MAIGMLGRKIGMTQRFNEEGHAIPVTVIEAIPCPIVQKKTKDKEGYNAIQIGYGRRKKNRTTRPMAGHFQKAGVEPARVLMESRVSDDEIAELEVGGTIDIDRFEPGDWVDVVGRSKGRGFAGVIKRHNFSGKNQTHGTHEFFRHGGSIGQCATPGRLFKGRKMPGQMGNVRTMVMNLRVEEVLPDQNLILIRGGIPGARNGMVLIRKAVKKAGRKKV
ncbi:MAG: 50S ribosomal protein L3 [Candidatus Eisenbacteria bacterium]|nr:50S ribosomal protein L3 [Candidatus Eisenbacteria bacterium]